MVTDEISVAGRVAIVSGGGRGLGRSYALELARRGASVVVNDPGADIHGSGSSPAAEQVAAEIRALGGRAESVMTAVRDQYTAAQVVTTATEAFGRCDILVNSAGILRDRTFVKTSEEEFDAVLAGHATGPFYLSQAAFRVMAGQGHGRIVLSTSAAGLFGNFGQANYALAKMGTVGLMKVLAQEGERHGVLVNAVAPLAATRMARQGLPQGLPERLGPDMVCPLVVYLCSDQSDQTMKVFSVGGGHFAEVFVAESAGWSAAGPVDAETVGAHLAEITSRASVLEFGSAFEEIGHVCEAVGMSNPRAATAAGPEKED